MPTLYTAERCPYAARARIALTEKGLDYDAVEIDLDDRPGWLYDKNALGRVTKDVLRERGVVETTYDRESAGYVVRRSVWNNRYFGDDLIGGEQNRRRAISFGTTDGRPLIPDVALFEHQSVATGPRRSGWPVRHGPGIRSPAFARG